MALSKKQREAFIASIKERLEQHGLTVADLVTEADLPAIKAKFEAHGQGGDSIH